MSAASGDAADPGAAARVLPPRRSPADGDPATMEQAAAMFGALGDSTVCFDFVVRGGESSWWVRAAGETTLDRAVRRIAAAWPGAEFERARPGEDPGAVRSWERHARVALRPSGDPALPLRGVWRDQLARIEIDPLESVAAAASFGGLRTIVRLRARAAGDSAAAALAERREDVFLKREEERDRRRGPAPARPGGGGGRGGEGGLPMWLILLALGGAVAASPLLRFYREAQWWQFGAVACALAALAAVLGFLWLHRGGPLRALGLSRPPAAQLPEEAVARKLSYPLLDAALEVHAAGPPPDPDGGAGDAEDPERAALAVARAYREFFGGAADAGSLAHARPDREIPPPGAEFRAAERLLLNAREAAAMWHLPVRMDPSSGAARGLSRRIAPPPGTARRGIPVGVSDADPEIEIRQPRALAARNQLVVAKTRRGKSTLLRHVAAGVMADGGGRPPALVVVDPHQDLGDAVLEAAPAAAAKRAVHLDFSNLERPIGLNLLDTRMFPERDLQVENVLTMLRNFWSENWGPRMEQLFRNALLSLHAVNRRREPDEQFTLLDVNPLLTDRQFRAEINAQADDPALAAYWRDNYERAGERLRQETANPVLSKVSRFINNEAIRNIFGQPTATFDAARVIRDGGVLVIGSSAGHLGESAAGLIGATLINLLAVQIEEQVRLAPERRRRVVCLVDESSTLGGVDYPRMLSELGKFGGSFFLVTQSLAKLDAVDEHLASTIFANIDGVTVFQCAAEDAERLRPELGETVGVEDIVGLDDFTAYARWWDGRRKPPAFSFRVHAPPRGSRAAAARRADISAASAAAYGRPREEVSRQIYDALLSHEQRGGAERAAAEAAEAAAERRASDRTPAPAASGPRQRGRRTVPPPPESPLPGAAD